MRTRQFRARLFTEAIQEFERTAGGRDARLALCGGGGVEPCRGRALSASGGVSPLTYGPEAAVAPFATYFDTAAFADKKEAS